MNTPPRSSQDVRAALYALSDLLVPMERSELRLGFGGFLKLKMYPRPRRIARVAIGPMQGQPMMNRDPARRYGTYLGVLRVKAAGAFYGVCIGPSAVRTMRENSLQVRAGDERHSRHYWSGIEQAIQNSDLLLVGRGSLWASS